jgi:hypothetical protein
MKPYPDHQRVVHQWFFELFAARQLDLLDELVAPDFVVRDPGDMIVTPDPASFKTWLQGYLTTFTDQRWTIHELISVGDKAIVRYSGQSTYQGGMFELPATNEPVREIGMLVFRIVDGKVLELWTALCDLELVFALGGKIVPAAES